MSRLAFVAAAALVACAHPWASAPATTPTMASRTAPQTYACQEGTATLAVEGFHGWLAIGDRRARFTERNRAGDHFVLDRDGAVDEYVVPRDSGDDVTVWTAEPGAGLVIRERCTAHAGHADVLGRWIRGDTVDQIAASLDVSSDDVRSRLIGAIRWARGRISYDRIVEQPWFSSPSVLR